MLRTAVCCLLVAFPLIVPAEPGRLLSAELIRIPVEALIAAALVLVLPARGRRAVALVFGGLLGLLAVVKVIDIGFHTVLDRPFDLVLDWTFFGPAVEFVAAEYGSAAEIGAVAGAAVLALLVLVSMMWAVSRLARVVAAHDTAATRTLAVLAVGWAGCAVLGAQLVPGVPIAAHPSDRMLQIRAGLQDQKVFAEQSAVDAFRDVPGDRLLTGLRGKDVVLAFVESYGRDAIEDPMFAPQVGAVLDDGNRRLRAAGFGARSGFLTSPTAGGGSWLAHATLLSGLWIDNQQRYRNLVAGDRLTLNNAFRRADWQTVAVMPGVTRAWPEGEFFGYDRVHHRWNIGYQGWRYNWGMPPDQYTLAAFERAERSGRTGRRAEAPVMAEVALVSSHAPWTPTPQMIGWDAVGDGKVFPRPAEDQGVGVREQYRRAVVYSLTALISYVEKYGDDDLVVVFLGDHEPTPLVTGGEAGRDVPITVLAKDAKVLDRISDWGWHDGIKPGPRAPVWRMSDFRDRFLTAFGPRG